MAETNITGPLWGYEQRNRRLAGLWSIVASSTYNLSAASSIDEGSGLTITVSGSNISDGTYYWTINHVTTLDADFSAVSGSFTITNNSGSFTVTPTADTTTEGTETFTVSIRSGSISGTVLATTSTETVNDTSLTVIAATAGYYIAGGSTFGSQQSTVRRIQFSNETVTNRASLSTARYDAQCVTNLTYGWVTGGRYYTPAPPPAMGFITPVLTSVERITFATDTSATSVRGSLSTGRYTGSGKGDLSNYGWLTDGQNSGVNSNVERITYSTDTATTTVRVTTTEASYYGGDATDSTTYSWYMGGLNKTFLNRFTFANDTSIRAQRGSIPTCYSGAVTYNNVYGWNFGGQAPSGVTSATYRITYASDTSAAVDRGYLHTAVCYHVGSGNVTKGYLSSGYNSTNGHTITYANDTATSSVNTITDSYFYKTSTQGII